MARHKWQPGESGNPSGRPKKDREVEYYRIFLTSVPFSEWRKIVRKAAEQAVNGDTQARKWLTEYIMGSPKQYLDLTSKGEKLFNSPLDEMTDDQRKEYFSKLSIALSGIGGSNDLGNTESKTE